MQYLRGGVTGVGMSGSSGKGLEFKVQNSMFKVQNELKR
jgi:hypothetical protein